MDSERYTRAFRFIVSNTSKIIAKQMVLGQIIVDDREYSREKRTEIKKRPGRPKKDKVMD